MMGEVHNVRMDDKSQRLSVKPGHEAPGITVSAHKVHPYIFLHFLQLSLDFDMTFDLIIVTRFVRNPISI